MDGRRVGMSAERNVHSGPWKRFQNLILVLCNSGDIHQVVGLTVR